MSTTDKKITYADLHINQRITIRGWIESGGTGFSDWMQKDFVLLNMIAQLSNYKEATEHFLIKMQSNY